MSCGGLFSVVALVLLRGLSVYCLHRSRRSQTNSKGDRFDRPADQLATTFVGIRLQRRSLRTNKATNGQIIIDLKTIGKDQKPINEKILATVQYYLLLSEKGETRVMCMHDYAIINGERDVGLSLFHAFATVTEPRPDECLIKVHKFIYEETKDELSASVIYN